MQEAYNEKNLKVTEDLLYRSLDFLSYKLAMNENDYLCSMNHFTIADIVAACDLNQLKFLLKYDDYLKDYGSVRDWLERVMAHPEM